MGSGKGPEDRRQGPAEESQRRVCPHCGAGWLKSSLFSDTFLCGSRRLKKDGVVYRTVACCSTVIERLQKENEELRKAAGSGQ